MGSTFCWVNENIGWGQLKGAREWKIEDKLLLYVLYFCYFCSFLFGLTEL